MPMNYLTYKLRNALKEKRIHSYNLWKGRLTVNLKADSRDLIIGHIQDIIDIGPADKNESCPM